MGAAAGLQGIPRRFIEGLHDRQVCPSASPVPLLPVAMHRCAAHVTTMIQSRVAPVFGLCWNVANAMISLVSWKPAGRGR